MTNLKISETLLNSLEARKQLANEDILFFAKYYLAKHVRTNIPQLHKEWYSFLKNEGIVIAAPRSHAKTTVFSLVYPLYCILFQKKKYLVLISDTYQQAEEYLGSIIQELEENRRIIEDFGKIAGYLPPSLEEKKKWTVKEIVTLTGIKVIARGWKSKLRGLKYAGYRPDLIILDDIENDENVQSEDQRKKVRNVFYKSILNLGDTKTQIIVVGTILHYDSLLSNLIIKSPPSWKSKLYRAIVNDRPIYPERWSLELLEKRRGEIGTIAFEQEFQN